MFRLQCCSLHQKKQYEENGSLPFLDTLLTRRNDGGLDVAVYRKPTRMDRYLQLSSHHPSRVKRSVASSLFHRARTIAVGENVSKEKRHLSAVLETNGYPDHFIRLATEQKTRKELEFHRTHTLCALSIIITDCTCSDIVGLRTAVAMACWRPGSYAFV